MKTSPHRRIRPARWAMVALFCLLSGAGCVTGGSTAMDYRTDARRALEADRLAEARAMAELAREKSADDPATRALLARIQRTAARRAAEAGALERAYSGFRAAAELEPERDERIDDLVSAVRVGEKAGLRPAKLAPLAQTILDARPDSADAHRRAAHLWDDAGQIDKALPPYRWLWERDPDDIQIGNRLAALLKQRDRLEAAAKVYRKVLEHDDTNVQASINLAGVLTELERPEKARALYERLLEAYPDKPSILLRYARFLGRHGEAERAEKLRERAHEKMPGVEQREMRDLR